MILRFNLIAFIFLLASLGSCSVSASQSHVNIGDAAALETNVTHVTLSELAAETKKFPQDAYSALARLPAWKVQMAMNNFMNALLDYHESDPHQPSYAKAMVANHFVRGLTDYRSDFDSDITAAKVSIRAFQLALMGNETDIKRIRVPVLEFIVEHFSANNDPVFDALPSTIHDYFEALGIDVLGEIRRSEVSGSRFVVVLDEKKRKSMTLGLPSVSLAIQCASPRAPSGSAWDSRVTNKHKVLRDLGLDDSMVYLTEFMSAERDPRYKSVVPTPNQSRSNLADTAVRICELPLDI